MSQICPVSSVPHAAILNDALQGSPGFVRAFKLNNRICVFSVFNFSFLAAMSKTRRTLGRELRGQLSIFDAINKLGHLQKFYISFERKQTQMLKLLYKCL